MKEIDRHLAAVAAQQRGVFTRAQAVDAGLTTNDIYYRVTSGLWVPRGPHTLTFAGNTLEWRGELLAGLLDLGPLALITARSAAAMLELDGFREDALDFLVPRELRRRKTVGVVMSTPTIGPLDRMTVDDLPVTSGTFTVLQLLGLVSMRELGNAMDSAIRAGYTAPAVLSRRLAAFGSKGRAGVGMLKKLMEADGVQSWLERQFLAIIRRAGLPKPGVRRPGPRLIGSQVPEIRNFRI